MQKAPEPRIRQSAQLTPAMTKRRHELIVPQPLRARITPNPRCATPLCDWTVRVEPRGTYSINRVEGCRYEAGAEKVSGQTNGRVRSGTSLNYGARNAGTIEGSTYFPAGSSTAFPKRFRLARRFQQIGGLNAQRYSQRLDVIECEVNKPGLDLADMRLIEFGQLGQALLAKPFCFPKPPNILPENAARRLWVRPVHLDGRTKAGLEIL